MTDQTTVFTYNRPLLFSIAYEILGSASDADDVLSESYLRWRKVDPATVDNPRAYLAQIVTRQALTLLRSPARRREDYVGPWLPEPLATAPDAADHVLTGEAVTTAMLLVLETLTPIQRAVFVLREVFAFDYPEIATAVDKSEQAVRQINHRARVRVHASRPKTVVSPAEAAPIVERFALAAATGDVSALMDLLAPGVVFIGDGGGVVNAVRRPVFGPDKVARLMIGLLRKGGTMGEMGMSFGIYNGMPAVTATINGTLDQVTAIEVTDDKITAFYCVRNPEKLTHIVGG
ncbi:RNA polymerase sigma-70 factor [Nocardia camponoti]|uniref:Sigma factor n=1 Tax=Nocardia camponoti TaxID=1616106 RepID=A0A917QF59_9NOCA|nr:RNA polymerase sigma-70 factor [Nocardia camponoti]GGK47655.1 putative sigma factor [Nocardia camponoti]